MTEVKAKMEESIDLRTIEEVLLEKAMVGISPKFYGLEGVEGWHPTQWTQNELLNRVYFEDGSIINIRSKRRMARQARKSEDQAENLGEYRREGGLKDLIEELDINETSLENRISE